jgi:predicted amidophosphoribosyltransferase
MTKDDVMRIGGDLAAFLLAASCAGCGEPGALLCGRCRAALTADPQDGATPRGMPFRAALPFDGVAARCIRRLKGEGDTFLARPLGGVLAGILLPAMTPTTWVVPVPTTRAAFRRRGYRVPDLLARRAGTEPQRVLRRVTGTTEQKRLGATAREENVRGAMRARGSGRGAEALIVDDVVTTGATLDEAARALEEAGFHVLGAVALAATPRRAGFG